MRRGRKKEPTTGSGLLTRLPYPLLARAAAPGAICRVPARDRTLYLTFDDGPSPETTPALLEILAQFGWTATFFVVGRRAEKHPGILPQIIAGGHTIGNHSYSHPRWLLTGKSLKTEITRTDRILAEVHCPVPRYFRPPHGRIFPWQRRTVRQLGKQIVLWDVFVPDYRGNLSPEEIFALVSGRSRPGSIVLLHDGAGNDTALLKGLSLLLESFAAAGWQGSALPTPEHHERLQSVNATGGAAE